MKFIYRIVIANIVVVLLTTILAILLCLKGKSLLYLIITALVIIHIIDLFIFMKAYINYLIKGDEENEK